MRRSIKRNDILLISSLIIISVFLTLIFHGLSQMGETVSVYVDGAFVCEYPLNTDTTVEIDGYNGGSNTMMISGGRVYVIEASCPDHLCIDQGAVDRTGRSIVCLPNRVVIKINSSKQGDYDAITQ